MVGLGLKNKVLHSLGWGSPEQLKRLFDFRRNMASRELCMKLVNPNHKIVIDKVQLDESGECKLIDGHFRSPFADHLPGLLPEVAETAYFQLVVPAEGWKGGDRPLCIQMAGTGDHHFWRRRAFLAKPLLKDHGISSLILENPFYGVRKPKEQFRSSLLNVSDIFVMGGSLILEGIALLHWCEREGFGPVVLNGISMGGHMASLAGVTWHRPICIVPCLSWSTASGVFTHGVLSKAINWKSLETHFFSNDIFKSELYQLVNLNNNEEAYIAGKEFVSQFKSNRPIQGISDDEISLNINNEQTKQDQDKNLFAVLTNFLRERGLLNILPGLSSISSKETEAYVIENLPKEFNGRHAPNNVQKEALQFMRGVMDEFTHLNNFSKPVDPSLIIAIVARDDAYVPRTGYQSLDSIWPGCDVRFVDCGHISAYILHQKLFKKTIAEAIDKYREKYHVNGELKVNDPMTAVDKLKTSNQVMDVLGFQNAKTGPDSSHRI